MITSIQNPKIRQARALMGKPGVRRENQFFVIEGVRLVEEALASGWPIQEVFFTEDLSIRGQETVQNLATAGTNVDLVSQRVMQSLSETETAQGLLAIMPIRQLQLPPGTNFLVIADAIRDPGNLGTLLRTAAAAAVQGILLAPNTTDAFAPKVVRAAMGAHFRIPILSLNWQEISSVLNNNSAPLHVYLADKGQGQACWKADLSQPCALIIGGEAEGPSAAARQLAQSMIHIPMPGGSESLNAAIAAAVLLFEVVRQRSA